MFALFTFEMNNYLIYENKKQRPKPRNDVYLHVNLNSISMIKKYVLLLTSSFLLVACNKDAKKQYSHWKVNGVAYSSNNVEATEAYNRPVSSVYCRDKTRFDISFNIEKLPHSGEFPVRNDNSQSPSIVSVGFCFNTVCYGVKENNIATLKASDINGKAQYALAPTWFVNFNNPDDSLLIEGIFNEP